MGNCGKKWVMVMLMGEFHHNIDEKGRLVIPTKLRSELGDNFIITKGIENVLYVYPIDKWNKLVEKYLVLITPNLNMHHFPLNF